MKRLAPCALALLLGCIKAPEIVVVDRATALEQQAGGSFADVEGKLARAAVALGPAPLTKEDLDALGVEPAPLGGGAGPTDADRVDALLRQRCLGEGRDGLLVDTAGDCLGAADRAVVVALVGRTNHARAQLWRWMAAQRPDAPRDALRRTWHEAHARGVVCGGWVQRDDGRWEAKTC